MKKILSMVLALALMMSLCVTVAATESSTSPTADPTEPAKGTNPTSKRELQDVSFNKTLQLTDKRYKDALGDNGVTFTFTATEISSAAELDGFDKNPGITLLDAPSLKDIKVTFTKQDSFDENLQCTKAVVVSLADKESWPTTPGRIVYKLKEDATVTGAIYDTNPLYLEIVIENDAASATDNDTGVSYTCILWQLSTTDKDGNTVAAYLKKVDGLTNQYKVGDLTVEKYVTGNMANRTDDKFTIKTTFTNTNGASIKYTIKDSSDTQIENGTGTVDTSGTQNYLEVSGIKHGYKIEFEGLPDGATWAVQETDTGGYTVTYGVTSNGNTVSGTLKGDVYSGTCHYDTTSNFDVTVTNEKQTDVNTGVVLESLPYVIILAIVAVGAVLFLVKKRKHSED